MTSETLVLQPIARFEGTLVLPGSKSLANRTLLLAALGAGPCRVTNLPQGDDTRVMVAALRTLGVEVTGDPAGGAVDIAGCGGPLPGGEHRLHLGNAGTAMRPLTAVLAAGAGDYVLEGVARMHERPIGDLVAALRELGARIDYLGQAGFPPLHVHGRALRGGTAGISGVTSSQFVTALLLAAPLAAGEVTIRVVDRLVSRPYVDMTMALMARFGVTVTEPEPLVFHVAGGQGYQNPTRALVEGDASSASYFLAGAAITGGRVRVEGCGTASLQGDARFAEVLGRMGAKVDWEPEAVTVTGSGRPLRGVDADLVDMPDAAMTLAVTALFAEGPTTLRGIANWRVKETDRMAAMATELGKLGAHTEVGPDLLRVAPPARIRPARIATYDDHRMAMAFSLAACGGVPITIEDPACVDKTFPTYFQELARHTVPAAGGAA